VFVEELVLEAPLALTLQESKDSLMRELYWRMIRPEEDRLPASVYEGLTRLCTRRRYAYFASKTSVDMTKASLSCGVVDIPGTYIRSHLSVAVTKRSPYRGILQY
jgi:hypothetical protein